MIVKVKWDGVWLQIKQILIPLGKHFDIISSKAPTRKFRKQEKGYISPMSKVGSPKSAYIPTPPEIF